LHTNAALNLRSKTRNAFSALRGGASGGGAAWFFLGNALSPAAAILLGPLVLGKVGLESYALLGLATYFSNMLISYADFSASTHLLGAFSRKAPTRFIDLGSALVLRFALWLGCLAVLAGFALALPRQDALYPLIAVSIFIPLLPVACFDWFLMAKRRYVALFCVRVSFAGMQVALTLAWFFSSARSALFVPAIALASSVLCSGLLLFLLGASRIRQGLAVVRRTRVRDAFGLARRILPMAAVLLLGPYFVPYALPWYTMASEDPAAEGAFSVGYRLIIGLHVLVVPLVLFLLSRERAEGARVPFLRVAAFSIVLCVAFWLAGMGVIHYYYAGSGTDAVHLPDSLRAFSILMIAVFFLVFRSPYVAACLAAADYKRYFLMCAASCLPVAAFSWAARGHVSPAMVPWLACIPDMAAAALFYLWERRRTPKRP
jgi:hypothetical protein